MKLLSFIIFVTAIYTSSFGQDMLTSDKISYRPPTVAGSFYPADPTKLKSMVLEFIDLDNPAKINGEILGLVVPHAGYVYSGNVAGQAFRELMGRKYDVVIVISPSHHKYFAGASVFNGDAYVTPLGNILVDKELSLEITKFDKRIKLSLDGHSWNDSINEHSLEVQLPFLQTVLPEVKIVPIVMGSQDFETASVLSASISNAAKKLGKKVLIIASSDLSHFHNQNEAKQLDKPVPMSFQKFDYFKLGILFFSKNLEACGGGPIVTMMMAAEMLGANSAIPVKYATSGDTPAGKNNPDRVVGYFSGIVYKDESKNDVLELPVLDLDNKKKLIDLVRQSVTKFALNDSSEEINYIPVPLSDLYTGFVTIKKHGELRACMGHIFPSKKLYLEIAEVAQLAASNDYRFGPISKHELNDLSYEISILSRFKRSTDLNEINVGEHGLYIRLKNNSGLLLPQVASERNWDKITFLENLCLKAGLSKDSYKDPLAEIYIFKALIINE